MRNENSKYSKRLKPWQPLTLSNLKNSLLNIKPLKNSNYCGMIKQRKTFNY